MTFYFWIFSLKSGFSHVTYPIFGNCIFIRFEAGFMIKVEKSH